MRRKHEVQINGVRHFVTDRQLRRLLKWMTVAEPYGTSREVATAYARQTGQTLECAWATLLLAQQLGLISGPPDDGNTTGLDQTDTSDGTS